jgi:RNA polymerase sigma-70 factor (ECF subfamily)
MNSPCDLDTAIHAAAARGRALWPGISVPLERFTAHVREMGVGRALLAKYGADLYFACACIQHDEGALRLFHSRVLPTVDPHVARLGLRGPNLDDLRQDLFIYLLADRRPRIAGYAGRGPLLGWLRTVAARRALRLQRAGAAQRRLDRAVPEPCAGPGSDPERGALKRRLAPHLQRALEESLIALSPRWKALLRMHYLDGLTVDAICSRCQVHRATVFRWFAAIRAHITEQMQARLRLPMAELEALIDDLRDDLSINVERFLAGERRA